MLEDLPSTRILKNIISLTAVKLKIVPVLNLSKPIISLLGCLELPVHLSEINIGKQVILQPIEPRTLSQMLVAKKNSSQENKSNNSFFSPKVGLFISFHIQISSSEYKITIHLKFNSWIPRSPGSINIIFLVRLPS